MIWFFAIMLGLLTQSWVVFFVVLFIGYIFFTSHERS